MINLTEEDAEQIAIIADGCKISQDAAEVQWLNAQHVAPDHLAVKVERIRELARLQKM